MNQVFFDKARKAAMLSNNAKHKIGAVLVFKGVAVAIACNNLKTHPKSPHPFKSLHAEMSAILKSQKRKADTIYVYRENKLGQLALARPCEYCQKLIKKAGIKKVYYTVDNGFAEDI